MFIADLEAMFDNEAIINRPQVVSNGGGFVIGRQRRSLAGGSL